MTSPNTTAEPESNTGSDATREDFAKRLVYSLLHPASKLADFASLPLKGFTTLAQHAYYQTKKDRGLTVAHIARQMHTSSRTIDRIAHSIRTGFLAPEREHTLPRQIGLLLWDGPKSLARIQQLLPHRDPEEVRQALQILLDSDRVKPQPGRTLRYAATRIANRLPDSSHAARVDALNNLLETILHTVRRRFFQEPPDPRAGARNVNLRICPEDIPKIEALYETVIWDTLVELDSRAQDCEDAVEIALSVCWAPTEDGPTPEDQEP